MKIYLHHPKHVGKTMVLAGVQFVDGVAEVPKLSQRLEVFYSVKDYPPLEDEKMHESLMSSVEVVHDGEMSINSEQEETVNIDSKDSNEDQKTLKELVESKKEELNKETLAIKDWKSMPWFTMKAYIKEMTGKSPKNKKSAIAIMKQAGFE